AKERFNKHKVLLSQSKDTAEKISLLDLCPTCLQQVPKQHKDEIFTQHQKNRNDAEAKLKEFEQKKNILQTQFIELNQQLEALLKKEQLQSRIKAELDYLQEKKELLAKKKEHLQEIAKENNQLIKELGNFKPEEIELIKQKINEKQEAVQQLIQKEELEQNLADSSKDLQDITVQLSRCSQEEQDLQEQFSRNLEKNQEIKQQQIKLEEKLENEKALLSEKAMLQTKISSIQQQIETLLKEIEQLSRFRSQLVRLNETHHWLEGFIVRLTYTIEKQVMLRIHHLFNNFFQEWFSILLEDENFTARIDDSFTPLIEQNGYEISFPNLSGGERTAASLAYRLALNRVINDLVQEIKTKDLLILDEPTDGFSSEQLDRIREVLDRLNLRQMLIVSHESKIESFVENVVRIRKEENESKIS
ncbi:MAG: hypothetical protein ABIA37_01440, partial [Candidatus Woesearchaeota archaeon]